MKKIGIVGGIAWASTAQYYAGLCRRAEARHRERGLPGVPLMPEITIESLDLAHATRTLGGADPASWRAFEQYHRAALLRLAASGAALAVIASNSAHERWTGIVRGVPLPVLDLFVLSAQACAAHGATRALILGTDLVMHSPRLHDTFASFGIQARAPRDAAIRRALIALIERRQRGETGDEAAALLGLVSRALADEFASASGTMGEGAVMPVVVCLACTELALILAPAATAPLFERDSLLFLDTCAVHVAAAFAHACDDSPAPANPA